MGDKAASWEAFGYWYLHLKYVVNIILIQDANVAGRHPLDIDEWLGVLEISQKYDIDIGIRQALDTLGSPPIQACLPLTARVRIAWEFRLEHLYEAIIRELLEHRPFEKVTRAVLRDLEDEVYVAYQGIVDDITLERQKLAAFVPEFRHKEGVHASIRGEQECHHNWREAYTSFTRLLVRTDRFFHMTYVLGKLKHADSIKEMHSECKAEMIATLQPGFLIEEDIVANGKATLHLLLQTTRPSNPRRHFAV